MANDQENQDFGDMGQQDQMYQYDLDENLDIDPNFDFSGYYDSMGTPDQASSSIPTTNDQFGSNNTFNLSGTPNQFPNSASTSIANNSFNFSNNSGFSGTPNQVSTSTPMVNSHFSSSNSFDVSSTPTQFPTFTSTTNDQFGFNANYGFPSTSNMPSTSRPMANDQFAFGNNVSTSGSPDQSSTVFGTNDQVDHSSSDRTHSHAQQQVLQQATTYQPDLGNNFDLSGIPDQDSDQDVSAPVSQNNTTLFTGMNYTYAPGPAPYALPTPQDSAIDLHKMSDLRPEDQIPRSMPPAPPNTPSSPVATPYQPDPQPRFTSFETARYQVVENARLPAAIPDDDFEDVLSNINKWVMKGIDAVELGGKTGTADNEVLQKFESESGKIKVERMVWWLLEQTVRVHQYGVDSVLSKAFDQPAGDLPIEEDMKCSERLEFVMMAVATQYELACDLVNGETMMLTILMPKSSLGLETGYEVVED